MNYHNITKDDMLNGDGLRVVLWVAGCNHGCKNCHNPITWDAKGGLPFTEKEEEEIFTELSYSYIDGITFSGGDPLFPQNRSAITILAKKIKQKFPQKTIWCYTGYLWEDVRDLEIMPYIDILVDGPFIQAQADSKLHWKGSANQRVIEVNASLSMKKIVLHDS